MLPSQLIIPGLLCLLPGTLAGHLKHRTTPTPLHPWPPAHPERHLNKHFAKIYYPPSGLGAVNPLIAFRDATPLNTPEKLDDYGFFAGTHYQTLAKIIYWVVKIWHFVIIVMQPFAFLAFNIAGVNYLREGINRYLSLVSPNIIVSSLRQFSDHLDHNGMDLRRLATARVDDVCLERMVCRSGLETRSMVAPILLRLFDNLKLIPAKYSKLVSIYWDAAVRRDSSTCREYVCDSADQEEIDEEQEESEIDSAVTEPGTEAGLEPTEPDIKDNEIIP
nr:PREDICTED: uncharacterized protein LOC109034736 [Bemisia tabaci]